MAIYIVFEPAKAGRGGRTPAERAVFVPDRFSWTALSFGPLWLFAKGLWLALSGYILFTASLGFGLYTLAPASLVAMPLILLMLNFLIAFEAAILRGWSLSRRGFEMRTIVTGHNLDDCERRFFASRQARLRPLPEVPDIDNTRSDTTDQNVVIGVFPRPGG
jgi:uncharacterized protein DUF2628